MAVDGRYNSRRIEWVINPFGGDVHRTSVKVCAAIGAISAAARKSCEGDAKRIITDTGRSNIIDIIVAFEAYWGATLHVDRNRLAIEFEQRKWDRRKEELSTWLSRKRFILSQMAHQYPTEATRNEALKSILLRSMPSDFKEVIDRLYVDTPATYEQIAGEIEIHHKLMEMKKDEPSGRTLMADASDAPPSQPLSKRQRKKQNRESTQGTADLNTLVQRMEKRLTERIMTTMMGAVPKGSSKGKGGKSSPPTCHRCGRTGHFIRDCRVRLDGDTKGKGKGSGAPKGKGKGWSPY